MFNNNLSNYPPGVTGREPEITGGNPVDRLPKNRKSDRKNNEYQTRFIANAELIEDNGIRAGQRYKLDRKLYEPNPYSDTVLLSGINHAKGVVIGEKGIIVYQTTPSSGLMYFWKGWTEEQFNEELRNR